MKKPQSQPEYRERSKVFIIEVFNYTIKVVVTNDVKKAGERHGVPITKNFAAFHTAAIDAPVSFIVLPENVNESTLAHECSHCVWAIMDMIGAKLEDEIFAYTLSHLIEKITAFVKNEPSRIKRVKKATTRSGRSVSV